MGATKGCSLTMVFPGEQSNRQVVEMIHDAESELKFVLGHYRVGHLVDFERNERGTVNTSFAVEIESDGKREKYFLRRYKTGVMLDEIQFEHTIIQHLLAKGLKIVAPVVETAGGETFISNRIETLDTPVYYALFKFLGGEDRYTWINPRCSQGELISAGITLAQFHQAISDCMPRGQKTEPKIFELLGSVPSHLEACLAHQKNSAISAYLERYADLVMKHTHHTQSALEEHQCQTCPQIVIHCDYHPGNLQFTGNQVSALFDFDWSKIDSRCFDVGLALFYFFTSWENEQDGRLRLEEAELFLKSYQAAFDGKDGIGALTSTELACLPAMIRAGNVYVLNWALLDCLHKEIDPAEYLVYLRHAVSTIQWLENATNLSRLQAVLRKYMTEIEGY